MCLQHNHVLVNEFGSGIVHALCIGVGIQGAGMDVSLSSVYGTTLAMLFSLQMLDLEDSITGKCGKSQHL